MLLRPLAVVLATASAGTCLAACPAPPETPPHTPHPPLPPPTVTTPPTPPPPPRPASGTRVKLATRTNDDSWDKMLVANGRLWVLTSVNHWDGPMYIPAARLWSVPVAGGDLVHHLDLEGFASLAADTRTLYVAVENDLSKVRAGGDHGRIFQLPLAGGPPTDLAREIRPRVLAVDGDTLWFDGQRMPKDGSAPPRASGVTSPIALALDSDSVYFTSKRGGAGSKPGTAGAVFRIPKAGGEPTQIASGLPDEPSGLAVDASHVYFSAVTWTTPETERHGIVGRVPKAGGDVEILAQDQPAVRALWLSAEHVFVRSGRPGREGAVLRIPKAGGEPLRFAEDATLVQATADDVSIYFSSDGEFQKTPFKRLAPAFLVRVFE